MSKDKPDSLLEMFLFEANQLTEQLETILLESESNQVFTVENINEIFRSMHTIKGSAAMMSYSHISSTAHSLEDLFYFIREEKPIVNVSEICDLVFKALDYIRYRIGSLGNGISSAKDRDYDEEFLRSVQSNVEKIKNGIRQNLFSEQDDMTNYIPKDKNKTKYKATVCFDDYCSMVNVRAFMVVQELSKFCNQVIHFPEDFTNGDNITGYLLENGMEITCYSMVSADEIEYVIKNIADVKSVIVQTLHEGSEKKQSFGINEKLPVEKDESRQNAKQNIIGVNINKLDKLIDIVGEIVISESMVEKNPDLTGLSLENFSKSARHLRKLTDELQDLVLSVRMIPVEMVFSKMNRILRDMSKKLNKEVTLEIIGESTEVDKNVIDHLSDPLMHLIRNCMDHGIETREERIKNNKDQVGKITLEAKNTGGDVIITVSDDGRGLDKQSILNKAKRNGLLTKGENLTDKEVYNFILLPGFSTREEITEFSGRGVGMDVVKKNIESVRGSISVDSEQAKGTVFTIKIPLTLAIIDGMMVKVGNSTFIIPTQSIVQSFRPSKGSVFSDIEDRDMIIIRGNCYAVTRLHKLFNIRSEITEYSDGIIILAEYNEKKLCLFADNLIGEQPVVVKSIPHFLSKYHLNKCGVGGCTILGDGSISLILDISEIASCTI